MKPNCEKCAKQTGGLCDEYKVTINPTNKWVDKDPKKELEKKLLECLELIKEI